MVSYIIFINCQFIAKPVSEKNIGNRLAKSAKNWQSNRQKHRGTVLLDTVQNTLLEVALNTLAPRTDNKHHIIMNFTS